MGRHSKDEFDNEVELEKFEELEEVEEESRRKKKGKKEKKKHTKLKVLIAIIMVLIIAVGVILTLYKLNILKWEFLDKLFGNTKNEAGEVITVDEGPKEFIDIVDLESKARPFAVAINNTKVAVKMQRGLNSAFLVYELPTEGNTSRMLAFFKDVDTLELGTIRSARHNFLDYCYESDAIFCHLGHSTYADYDIKHVGIDDIDGFWDDTAFWRANPEKLAYEHTAYTSIEKLRDFASTRFNLESESPEKTILLNYNVSDVDLSDREDAVSATEVQINYGSDFKTTFIYDEANKIYNRYNNGNPNNDYLTGETFNTKNIILQEITYSICDDGKYWDLKTQGTGTGYFITNGVAVPITWEKENRWAKTKYKYLDGTEIEVSDGRTYIEVHTNRQEASFTPNEALNKVEEVPAEVSAE